MQDHLFITGVVDLVGQCALELLGDGLLDALGDNGVFTVVEGVSLATSSGAGVMELESTCQ